MDGARAPGTRAKARGPPVRFQTSLDSCPFPPSPEGSDRVLAQRVNGAWKSKDDRAPSFRSERSRSAVPTGDQGRRQRAVCIGKGSSSSVTRRGAAGRTPRLSLRTRVMPRTRRGSCRGIEDRSFEAGASEQQRQPPSPVSENCRWGSGWISRTDDDAVRPARATYRGPTRKVPRRTGGIERDPPDRKSVV